MFMIRVLLLALFGSFGPFTLGIGMFIAMVIYYPSGVRAIQAWAQRVENLVDFEYMPDPAAVLANLLVDDSAITMLVFVVGAKFIFALVTELLSRKPPAPSPKAKPGK